MKNLKATSDDVAAWMLAEVTRYRTLNQDDAVGQIDLKFGSHFTYENERGNSAISKTVLAAFNKITGDSVVWERAARLWRFREKHDYPGRMQP